MMHPQQQSDLYNNLGSSPQGPPLTLSTTTLGPYRHRGSNSSEHDGLDDLDLASASSQHRFPLLTEHSSPTEHYPCHPDFAHHPSIDLSALDIASATSAGLAASDIDSLHASSWHSVLQDEYSQMSHGGGFDHHHHQPHPLDGIHHHQQHEQQQHHHQLLQQQHEQHQQQHQQHQELEQHLVAPAAEQRPHGQLVSKIVIDPPHLDEWRERLFNVDETIVLSNEEFETYFPHIDNVYSHRSTQKYKRKPFVSHYWDCRLKGRPSGTPKSDDPSKRKRKRNARERDLCDVKIKITEYFPGATIQADGGDEVQQGGSSSVHSAGGQQPGFDGERFWTIQRVNGNGGNGKGDGVAGPHKHTLQKSDEIKRSTVQRYLASQQKEARRAQKPLQRKTTGVALATARRHSKEQDIKLYASCFCPFSQRVWIALEAKGMAYQYCETDPFKRPTQLIEANPRGTVPAIREGEWASGESAIILEYLEDRNHRVPLFPTDPRLRANCRVWIDYINASIVPDFLALARAVDLGQQQECTERLQTSVEALVQAADERGPYFLGRDLSLVDIHLAPFVLRMPRILRDLRGWADPIPGTRWHAWAEALEHNPHVQATTSQRDLYLDTFDILVASAELTPATGSAAMAGSSVGGGGWAVA